MHVRALSNRGGDDAPSGMFDEEVNTPPFPPRFSRDLAVGDSSLGSPVVSANRGSIET